MNDYRWMRGKQPAESLSADALKWMAQLPEEIQPRKTAEKYARVVNRLAETAAVPIKLNHLLLTYLIDNRGGRKGFPPDVRTELFELQKYVQEKWPEVVDPWSHNVL